MFCQICKNTFMPRRVNQRYCCSEKDVQILTELLLSATLPQVARRLEISYNSLLEVVRRLRIPYTKKHHSLTEDLFRKEYLENKLTCEQVAHKYHYHLDTVYRLKAKWHITLERWQKDLPNEKLTAYQREFLIGTILGDSSIVDGQSAGAAHCSFRVEHGSKQLEYLRWKYAILQNFTESGIKESEVGGYFITKTHPEFDTYRMLFYSDRKQVSKELIETLTLNSLLFWYLDDGTLNRCNGSINNISIASQCFTEGEHELLRMRLEELLHSPVAVHYCAQTGGTGYTLYFPKETTIKFLKLLNSLTIPFKVYDCLSYKLRMDEDALVVLSGGQDSTYCLAWALYRFRSVRAVSFDYKSLHRIELEKATKICKLLNVPHEILEADPLMLNKNALTDISINIEKAGRSLTTFVPYRNPYFLLTSAIYARSLDIPNIICGVSQEDFSGYKDCREDFIKSFQTMLNEADDYPTMLWTPLLHMSKKEEVLTMRENKYANIWKYTHTCYRPINSTSCGECPSCRLRINAFLEAGYVDPVNYIKPLDWKNCIPFYEGDKNE